MIATVDAGQPAREWDMNVTPLPNDPLWIKRAFSDLGLHEIAGRDANARIVEMYARAGHSEVKDDEVAWCSAAVNCWMIESSLNGTGSLAARSWLAWGRSVDITKKIPRGAVLIFRRGNSSWQGHVTLCLDDNNGILTVIGGNQSDSVSLARYSRVALMGARWPDTAGNSRTIQSLAGSGAAEMTEKAVGGAADHLADNADDIGAAIGQAQDAVQSYAMYLRIAQYALIALSLAALAYAGWRFYARHLRPREAAQVEEQGPSIDDPVIALPLRKRNRRKRMAK
jgi:uncharacterized protein (TIGR02594 family)